MNSSLDQRKVGLLIGALIVLGVGIYFFQQSADKKEDAAKSALYQVETTYDSEQKALPEPDRAAGTALDVDAKFPKTVSGYKEMLTSKSAPSRILFEAGVKLGTLYLGHNQAEKAIPVLKETKLATSSAFQKATLFYLLGTAEERASQFKDASVSYQTGVDANVDGLKGELMLGLVRTSMKMNDKEKAKLYYEKMNKDLNGSRSTQMAAEIVKGNQS